jgi:hypothetical protein
MSHHNQGYTLYTLTGKKIGVMPTVYSEPYTLTGKKIEPTYGYMHQDTREDTAVYPIYSEPYTLTGKKIGPGKKMNGIPL